MCGIAATFLTPQARSTAEWQAIRDNFTANLLFNEARGRAATGLTILQMDGQVRLWKEPLPAHQFTATAVYRELLQTVGSQTTLILGHTRLPTKGDPANNGNNHPLQVGTVVGVHNGRIRNDDYLFARGGHPRQAEVDSEIIFRLIATNQGSPEAMKSALEALRGEFTFLAGNGRCPERLVVVKHRNPLSVHYQAGWQALIFSSRYTFLRKAFGFAVSRENIPTDGLLVYHAHQLAVNRHNPYVNLPLELNRPSNPEPPQPHP